MEGELREHPMRVTFIAMHIDPPQTGGEGYNLHLIKAAERVGNRLEYLAMMDRYFVRVKVVVRASFSRKFWQPRVVFFLAPDL